MRKEKTAFHDCQKDKDKNLHPLAAKGDWKKRVNSLEPIDTKVRFMKKDYLYQRHVETDRDWPNLRTLFEIDRDQVIFSDCITRLAGKAQVFIGQKNVQFKSRLTHTLEVTQIAKQIANRLNVNTDLTEAIALCHDIGHTAYGHMGEKALDSCLVRLLICKCFHIIDDLGRTPSEPVQLLEERISRFVDVITEHRERNIKLGVLGDMFSAEFVESLHQKGIIRKDKSEELAYLCSPLFWRDLPDGWKERLEKEFMVDRNTSTVFAHARQSARSMIWLLWQNDFTNKAVYGVYAHSKLRSIRTGEFSDDQVKISIPARFLTNGSVVEEEVQLTGSLDNSIEAQIVRLADPIAFISSDLQDVQESSEITTSKKQEIMNKLKMIDCGERWRRLLILSNRAISLGASLLCIIDDASEFLSQIAPPGTQDRSNKKAGNWKEIDSRAADLFNVLDPLRNILARDVYEDQLVRNKNQTDRIFMTDLFRYYIQNYDDRPRFFRETFEDHFRLNELDPPVDLLAKARRATDFLCWITDEEATLCHVTIFGPETEKFRTPLAPDVE